MRKVALGPLRQRRIILSLWLPTVLVYAERNSLATAAVLFTFGALSALRFARTRIELEDGQVTVMNFFRTVRLAAGAVQSAGFARARLDGWAVPVVLVGDGFTVRANGASIWTRGWRWPDQPFVRGPKQLARLEAFFDGSGIDFQSRDPVQRSNDDGQ